MGRTYRLGKAPARPGAVRLRLQDYLDLGKAPKVFGHDLLFNDYGMLGNDQYGDCVFAGAAHEHMLWNKAVGRDVTFTDQAVLSDYSAVTGFTPADPNSDQGTDMEAAAKYRRKIGIVDAAGQRHKIGAYLALDHKDPETLALASYLFGAVGVGIQFPGSAMDQFNAGKVWRVVRGAQIEGGHYVPLVGRRSRAYLDFVTWGRVQRASLAFVQTYADEAIVYLTQEQLDGTGRTPEGFDIAALQRDLAALK